MREIKPRCLTYTVQLTRMQNKVKLQSFQSTLCVWYRKKKTPQNELIIHKTIFFTVLAITLLSGSRKQTLDHGQKRKENKGMWKRK